MRLHCERLRIKGLLLLSLLFLWLPSGANAQSSAAMTALDDKPYTEWSNHLVEQIKADPQYKRLPLDTTKASDDFIVLMHEAYRKKISKSEFSQRVNTQYPGHQYEVSFIVSKLP